MITDIAKKISPAILAFTLASFALPDGQNASAASWKVDVTARNYVHLAWTVGEKVDSEMFIFEEQLEGVYGNNWWVVPLKSKEAIKSSGQAGVIIRAEGKSAEFSGHLVMNCGGANYYWKSASNWDEPLTNLDQANEIVPKEAIGNARKLICGD